MSDTKEYNQYFSKHRFIGTILPSGRKINFNGGVFITKNPEEIEYLDKEVATGNPFFFTKRGEEKITEEQRDPLVAIKKRAVEEYLEQQKRSLDPSRDLGSTVADKLAGITDTRNLVVAAASKSSK